jgi:cytidine deaminase
MTDLSFEEIVGKLRTARRNSYCPASNFANAAIVRTQGGEYFTGVNIEDAAWLSVCAEKAALCAMVSAVGWQILTDVWLMNGPKSQDSGAVGGLPCGSCRQFLAEYCDENTKIHTVTLDGDLKSSYSLEALLPGAISFQEVVAGKE